MNGVHQTQSVKSGGFAKSPRLKKKKNKNERRTNKNCHQRSVWMANTKHNCLLIWFNDLRHAKWKYQRSQNTTRDSVWFCKAGAIMILSFIRAGFSQQPWQRNILSWYDHHKDHLIIIRSSYHHTIITRSSAAMARNILSWYDPVRLKLLLQE